MLKLKEISAFIPIHKKGNECIVLYFYNYILYLSILYIYLNIYTHTHLYIHTHTALLLVCQSILSHLSGVILSHQWVNWARGWLVLFWGDLLIVWLAHVHPRGADGAIKERRGPGQGPGSALSECVCTGWTLDAKSE